MKKHILVAVDIRSAHNVGSFFRSCDGLGFELALVGISPRPCSEDDDRLPHVSKKADKEISKTALGAEKTVKWVHYKTLKEAKISLEKDGCRLIAIEQASSSKSIKILKPDQPLAIVVGREVEGLSENELTLCEEIYEIPMQGGKESFNVSVAAAIAMYQIQ